MNEFQVDLTRHNTQFHKSELPLEQCQLCPDKPFLFDLKNHTEKFHRNSCPVCPKIVQLNNFVRKVSKKKIDSIEPYHCVECGKKFSWKNDSNKIIESNSNCSTNKNVSDNFNQTTSNVFKPVSKSTKDANEQISNDLNEQNSIILKEESSTDLEMTSDSDLSDSEFLDLIKIKTKNQKINFEESYKAKIVQGAKKKSRATG